jgi:single-stranded-DNA-specific exonuclease
MSGHSPLLGVESSVKGRKWISRAEQSDVEALLLRSDILPLTAQLLAGRDVTSEKVDDFLNPRLKKSMPDPSALADMDKAIAAIFAAIDQNQKICVFADYDVDGATSAAQLLRWARGIGQEWELYVPDRLLEGYGPSAQAFEQLKSDGTDLVITVDCGAAAAEALEHASEIGLDIIVIDHHLMGDKIPDALAVINPNRADDTSGLGHLAAAGVCFLTVVALNREAKRRGLSPKTKPLDLLGLAALGTICDVVPLTGLNRAIVAQGLKVLSRKKEPGIEALADIAKLSAPFTTSDAGFGFGPRINAGGRIGVSFMGAEMLSTENAQIAYSHAAELDRVNTERRAIQTRIQTEAMDEALKLSEDSPILIVSMKDWHAGIIGIVAGRIKDRLDKPAIVIGIDSNGVGKGSGRSIKGVNLGKALSIAREEGLLLSGGGHEMAGGLTIDPDKIEAFTNFMTSELNESFAQAKDHKTLKIDSVLHPRAVSLETLDILEKVAPYGAGNPTPAFVLPDMLVTFSELLRGGHVRVNAKSRDGTSVRAIAFRADESGLADMLLSSENHPLHLAGKVQRNEWNGRISADFHIIDAARANM